MLLDLFVAQAEGRRVHVGVLCDASAVPSTTALRWMALLIEQGLVEKHPDERDARRAYVALTPGARDNIEALLARCA